MTKRGLGLVASMLVLPLEARAHVDAGWTHGVVDGVRAFAGSIQYLFPVLAAALIARRGSGASLRNDLLSLIAGVALGMFGGCVATDALSVVVVARIQLILLGLIVLSDLRLPTALVSFLCLLAGGVVGLEHGVTPSGDPWNQPAPALGFLLTASAAFTAGGLVSQRFRTGWQRIAIRVVGSWLATIGAIHLAFLIAQIR
jgi:hypothetical protein